MSQQYLQLQGSQLVFVLLVNTGAALYLALNCAVTLSMLKRDGFCQVPDDCITGCINEDTVQCGPESLWRDQLTCVESPDCMCVTPLGIPIKPGIPVNVTQCEVCQCINNQIECDKSICETTIKQTPPIKSTTPVIYTVTPPVSSTTPKFYTGTPIRSTTSKIYTGTPPIKSTPKIYTETSPSVMSTPPEIFTGIDNKTRTIGGGDQMSSSTWPVPTTEGYETFSTMKDTGKPPKLVSTTSATTVTTETEETPTIVTLTENPPVTPPPACPPERRFYLIDEIAEVRYKQSSRNRSTTIPKNVWRPLFIKDAYLQVDLRNQEPIHGSVVWGYRKANEYVTSYKVMYSNDGKVFYYVKDKDGKDAIFRGPADSHSKVEQFFDKPVEAQFIRWIPQGWKNFIAMKVELIGCKEIPSGYTEPATPSITPTRQPKICEDPMGLENGRMADQQITASSVFKNDIKKYGPSHARVNNSGSWVSEPTTLGDTPWIQFDFLEPRILTGIITQGNEDLDIWVTKYTVEYSHDGTTWNNVLESGKNTKKVFLANFDSSSPFINMFERMIHARYLRLIPTASETNIGLRVEVIGCYVPYPTVTYPEVPETTTPRLPCTPCKGWQNDGSFNEENCQCPLGKFWDGNSCVHPRDCPCYEGYTSYIPGSHFDTKDCESCICKMGGEKICEKNKCPRCEDNLQWVLTPRCGCVCKPCQYGTILCPTSNICINKTSWCDGVEDCPDDERTCPTPTPTTTPYITTLRTIIPKLSTKVTFPTTSPPETTSPETTPTTFTITPTTPSPCPEMKCQPGFIVSQTCLDIPVPSAKEPLTFKGRFEGIPSARLTTKGAIKAPIRKPQKTTTANCPQFCCIPEIFCKPECPSGFDIQYTGKFDAHNCREFKCIGTATCNITGQSFNTFDGTDFQFEICNHILARDLENYLWDISIYKTCPDVCSYHISINHNEQEINIHSDLSVTFNGQDYKSITLLKRIGYQLRKSFTISNIGGYVLFKSRQFGFQLIWDRKQTLEISIPDRYAEQVDGLCGFFNYRIVDDKLKPDGSLARTTKEFGDSWKNPNLNIECEPREPCVDQLKIIEKICSHVKESLFTQCKNTVDLQRFLSQCTETTCACLQNENSTEASCQCEALLDFVKKCSAADPTVDISSWRIKYNCPAVCPPPLVYHDCYQRQCEPNCLDMKTGNDCPVLRGKCFSGCFCPEGLVRNGDNCVKPEECRDCTCDGFGDPQYMTFDYTNYTFNGNCTYVASRDKNPNGKHTYEVLVTNIQCEDEPISTCTRAVHIKYEEHTIVLKRKEATKQQKQSKELVALLDGDVIQKYPLITNWVHIEHIPGSQVTVLIPKIQLEVSYFYHNFAFAVRLPSYTLGHKAEGLCGNCNGDSTDDLKVKNGEITNNTTDFGLSWLHPLTGEDNCKEIPDNPCVDVPSDQDPCYIILDKERFGKCHPLEDPYPYLRSCQYDKCHSVDKEASFCRDVEAYARACMDAGLCLDWRSNTSCAVTCPPGKVYQECGPGCPLTCDNYKTINQNPSSCSLSKVAGCFCPDGEVLLDGKCKPVEHCHPCDKEGHVQGQIWNTDKCTTCMCAKDGNSKCLETQCPNKPLCELGSQLITKPGTENDCCPQYTCTPPPNCTEVNKPVCGNDQILKIIRDKNNCARYVCDCEPCENTTQLDEPLLGPGFVRKLDTSGCCPIWITDCRPETCPKPTPCPEFYNLIVIPPEQGQCCPTKFECRPPDDKCIYTIKFTSGSTGGEIPVKQQERLTVLKNVGNSWTDGPCRTCVCEKKPLGAAIAVCTTQTCVNQISDEDKENYDFKIESVFNQCCPTYVPSACKQGNQVYEVGQSWPSPDGDPCKFYKCISKGGVIQKELNVHTCNANCQLGYRYETPDKDICCGQCRPFACVDEGKLKHVNTNWTSPNFCTNYFCREKNGSYVIDSETERCPAVPPEIENDFTVDFVDEPGKCCRKIVQVACRVGFRTYKVNESWQSPDGNPCITYKCEQSKGGQLKKTEYIEKCNLKCKMGEEPVPPPPGSTNCCGQCIPRFCVHDNKTYEPGEWYSSDNCTHYECKRDSLNVVTTVTTCPPVGNCKPEDIVQELCCKRCKTIPTPSPPGERHICKPEDVAANKTIKLINVGGCTNLESIRGFKECEGTCNSFTVFNRDTQIHESNCKCCQPVKFNQINVDLTCTGTGGTVSSKTVSVSVPEVCSCEVCSDNELFLKVPNQ